MLKALVSDQLLLFQLLVENENGFLLATSSSYDHLFQFPRRSLTRASTVLKKRYKIYRKFNYFIHTEIYR